MTQLTMGIVGAGNMGRALARRLAAAEHSVLLADHDDERARSVAADIGKAASGSVRGTTVAEALTADIVLLAIYYPGTLEFAGDHEPELRGKVVVDISNPLDESFIRIGLPPDSSGAERLAAEIPDARVVKAFNTIPAAPLARGSVDGIAPDCFVASDDGEAKETVLRALDGTGLRPVDAGLLENARLLERVTAFGIELGQRYSLGFEFGFKYLPASIPLGSAPLSATGD